MIEWRNDSELTHRAMCGAVEIGRVTGTTHGIPMWYWGFHLAIPKAGTLNRVDTSLSSAKNHIETEFDAWLQRAALERKAK